VKRGIWNKNPYSLGLNELKSRCKSAKSGKAYSDSEASIIIEAFATDRFTSKHANIKHSYYYEFLKFLFLTGVRPWRSLSIGSKLSGSGAGLREFILTGHTQDVSKYRIYPLYILNGAMAPYLWCHCVSPDTLTGFSNRAKAIVMAKTQTGFFRSMMNSQI